MMETQPRHIDLSYLRELSNGNNEFILQMIDVFKEQTPDALEKIEKYYAEKNWTALAATAHKIKPSFGFMGIRELQSTIVALEDNVRSSNFEKLPALISEIKKVCLEALGELEKERKYLS